MPTADSPTTRAPTNSQLQCQTSQPTIMTPAQARNLIEREGWITPNRDITAPMLASALTRLAHTVQRLPKQVADGINAIATLLASLNDNATAQAVASKVTEAIQPTIDKLTEIMHGLKEATDNLQGGMVANANTMEEFREEVHALQDLLSSAAIDLAEQVQATLQRVPPASCRWKRPNTHTHTPHSIDLPLLC
jgi:methyl-accepting chemotaxis protein